MKKVLVLLVAAALAASCHNDSIAARHRNYQTVDEGSASGVTSTINAPGEVPPPMTGTNADTTSNLALTGTAGTLAAPPGTLAGTLPSDQSGSIQLGYPVDANGQVIASRPAARPVAPRVATTQPSETSRAGSTTPGDSSMMTSAEPAPPEPQPTSTTTAAPPTTSAAPSTGAATTTAPSDTAPPSTDTSTTTSPPPTTT